MLGLFHGRQIDHIIGHLAVFHGAVRAFDKAVFVNAREGRQRVDQADIRTFRRFNRADPAIMGRMHIAHLKTGALAGQTTWSKRRKTALMGNFRKRIGLIHKLRQL